MQINASDFPSGLPCDLDESNRLLAKVYDENQHLKQELSQLKRMIFGQKRERFVPAVPEEQMTLEGLFETAGAKIPGFAETKEQISYERRKPKKGHGRKPIPDDLHREKHIIDVPESEKVCSCCNTPKKHIGDEITEELEYQPAVFFANQYIRPKYACPKCPDNGITTSPMPPRPIDKGLAGPGLLAYIIVSKYVDHLPLYRLEQMFKRYNIHINRSTMVGWLGQICSHLDAIYREMHRQLLAESFLIQADETTLKILDKTKEKCELGYLWPYVGDGKLAVFEFRESRAQAGPTTFLSNFKERYLLSDGYAGYNEAIREKKLKHLMCWAHARRNFFEAKDLDRPFVEQVLNLIQELYKIERDPEDRKLKPSERYALRLEKSKPILDQIKALLENPGKVILPKSNVAGAIAYTLNHWEQLTRFLEDGRLPLDNNLVENSIRPIALAGRTGSLRDRSKERSGWLLFIP